MTNQVKRERTGEMPANETTNKTAWRDADIAKLAELESEIEDAGVSFIRTGRALRAVRTGRLHGVAGCDNFLEYCQNRWEMSRAQVYRLMDALDTYEAVSKLEKMPLPVNEAQCRELARLKNKNNPELQTRRQQEAWSLAVKLASGEQPTQAVVAEAVRHCLGKPKPAPAAKEIVALAEFKKANKKFVSVIGDADLEAVKSGLTNEAAAAIRQHIYALNELLAKLQGKTSQGHEAAKAA